MKKSLSTCVWAFFFLLLGCFFFLKISRGYSLEYNSNLSFPSHISLEALLRKAKIPEYSYQVVTVVPHNRHNFTEGLVFEEGFFYESTGLNGQSSLQKIEATTGKLIQIYPLPSRYFGEGTTILGDKLYQLTYLSGIAFMYDKNTFSLINLFQYKGQGWGLATDGKQLIMSNGTATLNFRDPLTFQSVRTLIVKVQDQEIDYLNELEYIDGKIYANVWPTSIILIISPDSGLVEGWLNINALKPVTGCNLQDCVANGIAYNANESLIYVTGKDWPSIYALSISPP